MILKQIVDLLEDLAPLQLQESYDNSGLLIGNINDEINSALVCIDCNEDIIDEAIKYGANLVISHHPLIFKGLKRLNGSNYVERTIIKAIKNNIAIYSIHTNLDNVLNGVNGRIAEQLEIENYKILKPLSNSLKKIVCFCPILFADKVRKAMFSAGAGNIGNYSECSFNIEGEGTFKANKDADPYVGEKDKLHFEKEIRIETIVPNINVSNVVKEMINAHPYQEVAYDIYNVEISSLNYGAGIIGDLPKEMSEIEFLTFLKEKFNLKSLKHTSSKNNKIKRIAFCGGSGSFLINNAISSGADVYVSADIKYHEFFDVENRIMIVDIGHYESEFFTKDLIHTHIKKIFPKFAIRISEVNTNPVKYF